MNNDNMSPVRWITMRGSNRDIHLRDKIGNVSHWEILEDSKDN